jgi:hypothetical protein
MNESNDFGARAEREWQNQERALRLERNGAAARGDSSVDRYRLIVRALRDPPLDPLPLGFAADTAARAERDSAPQDRFEAWLEHGLLTLLGIAAVAALGLVGAPALEMLGTAVGSGALGWGAAIAACIGLSSALDLWRKRPNRATIS